MFGNIKNYVQDKITLAKLEGVESIGRIISRVTVLILMAIFATFFLLIISFAAGYYISLFYDSYSVGFLIVAGFYFLLFLLLLIFKKGIQNLIINMVISSAMSDSKSDIKRIKKENK